MKIVSWNVNGIRACARKSFMSFIREQDPDILCIQESKAHLDDIKADKETEELVQPLSRLSYWSSADRKGYSGTVTFVKKPAQTVSYGIGIKKFDHEGRFVITQHNDLTLFNVYFPNGAQTLTRHVFKQEFLHRFSSYLKRFIETHKNVVVLGDYNVAYLDQDVFDPIALKKTSGFLPEERQWFKDFLKLGFVDSFRHLYPKKEKAYTWWSYRENARRLNRGWRIDHITVTKPLVKRLKAVDIMPSWHGSDHCPVVLQLQSQLKDESYVE